MYLRNEKQNNSIQSEDRKKDFAEFWGPMMPTMKTLKWAGHIGSAVTQSIVIFQILNSELSQFFQDFLILASILLTGFISFVIEGGLSKFAPFVFRTVLRKKLKNKWSIGMFLAVLILVLPLAFASTLLSWYGGAEIIDQATTKVSKKDLSKEDDTYQLEIKEAKADYKDEKTEINTNYDEQVNSNHQAYASKIGIQQGIIKKYKRIKATGEDWAQGHIDKALAQINALKAERDGKKSEINQERSSTLLAAKATHDNKVAEVNVMRDKHITKIQADENEEDAERKSFVNIWGGFLSVIAVFFALGTLIIIGIIEMYRAGAGQEYDKKIDNGEPNRWLKLWLLLSNKFNNAFDAGLEWIEQRNAPSPSPQNNEPSIGYKMSASANNLSLKEKQNAKAQFNPSSVRTWYKRSSLCSNPEGSGKADVLERNKAKYLAAKEVYLKAGVEINEKGHTVEFKF